MMTGKTNLFLLNPASKNLLHLFCVVVKDKEQLEAIRIEKRREERGMAAFMLPKEPTMTSDVISNKEQQTTNKDKVNTPNKDRKSKDQSKKDAGRKEKEKKPK